MYLAADGSFWDLFCCLEDVTRTAACEHVNDAGIEEQHIICKHCRVPISAHCYEYMHQAPLYASPMALADGNFIGYTHKTILQDQVKWIEAAAAQPAWTTMMCYYIEGDQGHLMEETMFDASYTAQVRGDVFSYHMPWDPILHFLHRTTADEKLALLPHDHEHLAHMVQLHLRSGTVDMAKHIKEVKVRAHVVLKLGYDVIRAGHAAYVSTGAATTKAVAKRMRAAK